MKTSFLFLFSFLFITAFTQSPLDQGERQLNAGFGFSDNGIPIYVGADFGIGSNITLGAEASYRNLDDAGFDLNTFALVGIFDYHLDEILTLPAEWNIYAGANAGFYFVEDPAGYSGNEDSEFGFGLQVGSRYFFSDRLAVNLQFGGGSKVNDGRLGITLLF